MCVTQCCEFDGWKWNYAVLLLLSLEEKELESDKLNGSVHKVTRYTKMQCSVLKDGL